MDRVDQWLDWNSFVNLVNNHENPSQGELLDAFRMLDEKSEGRVHEKQLREVLMGEGERLSPQEVDEVLKEYKTADGYIHYETLIRKVIEYKMQEEFNKTYV